MNSELEAKIRIYHLLDEMVGYTVNWLHIYFGISKPLPPVTNLSNASEYDPETKTIYFQPEDLAEWNYKTIGHEVSHYLHHVTNPAVAGGYNEDRERDNLLELVAEYGAYLFSRNLNRHPSLDVKQQEILNLIKTYPLSIAAERVLSPEEKIFSFEVHHGGCSAARYLYDTYGIGYLRKFAQATVEEAKELLLRLDWKEPLFIPYSEMEVEYTTE